MKKTLLGLCILAGSLSLHAQDTSIHLTENGVTPGQYSYVQSGGKINFATIETLERGMLVRYSSIARMDLTNRVDYYKCNYVNNACELVDSTYKAVEVGPQIIIDSERSFTMFGDKANNYRKIKVTIMN